MMQMSSWFAGYIGILVSVIVLMSNQSVGSAVIDDLPSPIFIMNITQDEQVGVEKRVYRRLAVKVDDADTAPLFEGMGTHYAFIWVGTPPQRVSVIMDTGSHHTAFPCTGCKCGKHMDPHFDPQRSSTNSIPSCGGEGKKCYFKQSYTEGSSWSAFKVRDKVWVGGPEERDVAGGSKRAIDFDFGCQESETGLFRTQKVDGIMGLSAAPDTLPYQLHAVGMTKTKMFALCFRSGGGVVTLGGVDTRLHAPALPGSGSNRSSQGGLMFAALLKPKGWYTVKLLDVLMRAPTGDSGDSLGEAKSIGGDPSKYATGKGTIVDSGTTDTYLPSALRSQFAALFRAITGKEYGNKQAYYTKEQFRKLPTIVFRLLAAGMSGFIDLEVAPSSYMEFQKEAGGGVAGGAGRYTPRIYLTEGSGAVLGANAINEHNVVFDPDHLRVGFAKSKCTYDKQHGTHDFATSTNAVKPVSSLPPLLPAQTPAAAGTAKPKPKSGSTAPKEPVHDFASGVTAVPKPAAPAPKQPAALPVAKVPLTGEQQLSLDTILTEATYQFVATRSQPCKRELAIPCSARCVHSDLTAPVEDTGSLGVVEYLRVDSSGTVSLATATMVQGQQYWRDPQCSEGAAGIARRTEQEVQTDLSVEDLALAGDWSLPPLVPTNVKTVMEECAIACPNPSRGAPADPSAEFSVLPVRVHPEHGIENTASQCDPVTHTRKQLRLDLTRTVDLPSSKENVIVQRTAGKQHCVVVENGQSVVSNAAQRPHLEVHAQCKVVAVVDTPCKPYFFNCSSTVRHTAAGERATSDGVVGDANDVVFALHLRLKGLAGGVLTELQESDLLFAFANLFQVPLSSLSVAVSEEHDAQSSFSIRRSSTPVQVYVRLNVPPSAEAASASGNNQQPSALQLPADALKVIAAAAKSRAGGSPGREATLFRQLLRDQLQAHLESVIKHAQFPTLLAMAVADADPSTGVPSASRQPSTLKRPGWLVSSAISAKGVTALAGRIDSTNISAGEKQRRDAHNAATCSAAVHGWPGLWKYLGLDALFSFGQAPSVPQLRGGGQLGSSVSLFFYAMGTVLAAGTFLLTLWYLLRRYLLSRERAMKEAPLSGAGGSSGYLAPLMLPSALEGGDSGVEDEGRDGAHHYQHGHQQHGHGNRGIGAHAQHHKDRRRKVLQKFSVKK